VYCNPVVIRTNPDAWFPPRWVGPGCRAMTHSAAVGCLAVGDADLALDACLLKSVEGNSVTTQATRASQKHSTFIAAGHY